MTSEWEEHRHQKGAGVQSEVIMARVVSTDGRFAWNGHRWKLVTDIDHVPSPFDSEQAAEYSLNRFSSYPSAAEEIELSLVGESTPLLSTVAAAPAAVASAPSVAAIAAGTALAAGTIIIGSTLGSSSSDDRDPIVTFLPFYFFTFLLFYLFTFSPFYL